MGDIAIKVEGLSKRYVISHQRPAGDGLRHVLQDKLTAPFGWFGKRGAAPSQPSPLNFQPSSEDFWALQDVSFEIKQGEVVGIIGRNGAGKSTLLKILSRITEPTKGRVTIKGRIASLLEVGTGFHPELTGRENIFLNGAILGMSRLEIKAKFDEIVAFAEIEKFLDTPVKRYSSGMYVRLAFAVSAHLQTDILIIDEVLAVGDTEFQKKCLGKMQEVSSSEGRTVLFVSHQLGAVRRLCSHGCLLVNGRTAGINSVETVLNHYTAAIKESPFDVDLTPIARTNNLGTNAKLLRLTVPAESTFRYGEPLTIVFSVLCDSPISNANIGIGFDTLDGHRILTLDSDNSAPPLKLPAGRHEIRFHVPRNPLHPSTYACGAAIMAGGQILDALPNCVTWEVSSSQMDVSSFRGFAGCRVPVDVSVSTSH